ncbi:hypothetical protein [Nocardia anaemiae]|uniref:hypothetical protein n=1 Tax=Nocardia anaemiae TaxID=263910 RepID=UPI0007A386D6|nr:hypothetical protein [Nocardia anaemiae]
MSTALRAAGGRAATGPVDTRELLVALMRADAPVAWHRIWLHVGDADAVTGKVVVDPNTCGEQSWEDIQLTQTCSVALDVAWRLTCRYNMWPLPVGILAIGLVADDSSAAAQALRDGGLSREELLDLLQSDILGVPLIGLDTILPTVSAESHAAHAARSGPPAGPPPSAPMIAPTDVDPEYWRRRRQVDIAVLVAAVLMIVVLSVAYAIRHDRGSHRSSGMQTSTSVPAAKFDLLQPMD